MVQLYNIIIILIQYYYIIVQVRNMNNQYRSIGFQTQYCSSIFTLVV